MRRSHDGRRHGRLAAWVSAAVLVVGSVGFAAPSFAAPSFAAPSDSGHGHPDNAHTHPQATAHHGGKGRAGTGHSHVSLSKPNHYQAQADPDGAENGGVDQPGGLGGVDTTTQDGNNGSGNDTDCEDDNNGVGVPGHCKQRPAPVTPPASDHPSSDHPVDGSPVDGAPVDTGAPSVAGLLGVQVAAPSASGASSVLVTSAGPADARSAATVLPNTGAGQALLGLAIAALAALAVGAGLVRQGHRTTRVSP